ncbi:MAG: aminopeptidase [Thermoplasmata archaeon]|nr:MAG: aminopeptidase [Thermoplasmata archaeon]
MYDIRYETFAKILCDHSLELKKDDVFIISGSHQAMPLIYSVYKIALEKGTHPHVRLGSELLSETYYKKASENQLNFVSPLDLYEIKHVDARLSIISTENTRYMNNVDPKMQQLRSRSQKPIHDIFLKRATSKQLRWCVTLFPTNASAQDAEMSLTDYEEFVLSATHIDEKNPVQFWKNMGEKQKKIQLMLEGKKVFRINADDTDLTVSCEGRKWVPCFGKENFPDGEIFTGPIEHSAEGFIHFSYPLVYGGRRVDDVKLWFEKGKVVKAKAAAGQEFLDAMLNMDDGARRLGEFAFGTNYGIKEYTKNILFDEKIGGTIHLAVGSGYPETGSINESSLHWDMVIDMRKNASVFADEECIYKNGSFKI